MQTGSTGKPCIEYGIVEVSGDKPFYIDGGARRSCVIVEISPPDAPLPCYIFEFSRPDEWSISTLFIRSYPQNDETIRIEQKIPQILSNAVEGNAHWAMEKLTRADSLKPALLKHTKNLGNWSERIMNKLIDYGFSAILKKTDDLKCNYRSEEEKLMAVQL